MFGLLAGAGEIGRGEMDRERLDKKKASAAAADKGAPPKRKKRTHEEKALPLKPVQQPKVRINRCRDRIEVLPSMPFSRRSVQSTITVASPSRSHHRITRLLLCLLTRRMVLTNLTMV